MTREPAAVVPIAPAAGSRERGTVVQECPGGPLLVRGPARIVDAEGAEIPRRRGTVALCRCAGSSIPPWCDGTHRLMNAARRRVD